MTEQFFSAPTPFSLSMEPTGLAAKGSSRADMYYFAPRWEHLSGSNPDDKFYSYKDSAWILRSALPPGAQIILVTHCSGKGDSTNYVAEAACEKNAEYLRAQIEAEGEQGGGGASSAEVKALQDAVAALQTALAQAQNTANSAVSKADAAQNTANTANTAAANAQNTANAANTAAANVQTNVNNLTNVVNGHAAHYVGTAAPNNAVGKNGDVYLQTI